MKFVTKVEGFNAPVFTYQSEYYKDKVMYNGPPKFTIPKPKSAGNVDKAKVNKIKQAIEGISKNIDSSIKK